MTPAAQALLDQAQAHGALAFVVFLRVGAAMALAPAFGERMLPVRVRLALALAFTAVVAPGAAPLIALPAAPDWPRLLVTETLAGLALGAGLRMFVMALQMAAAMAAQATSLAQILGGTNVDPQPAIGHVMVMGGLALACLAGLHVKLAALFLLSYRMLPAGGLPPPGDLVPWGVAQAAGAFGLALALAAPFVIASLVYNVALGVINKAMPQLMVAFVGAPAITAGSLILLALLLPVILHTWHAAFDGFLADPAGGPP